MKKYCLTQEARKELKGTVSLIIGIAKIILITMSFLSAFLVLISIFDDEVKAGMNVNFYMFGQVILALLFVFLMYLVIQWLRKSVEKC